MVQSDDRSFQDETPSFGLFSSTRNMVRRNSTVIRNRIKKAWDNVERFRRPTIKRAGKF